MISTNDIKNILIKAVKANPILGVIPEIVKDKHKPVTEEDVKERIVVVVNASDNSDWQQTYSRVCVYVPDIKDVYAEGKSYLIPNAPRLNVLEKECNKMFFRKTIIEHEGQTLYYKLEDIIQEEDPETWSHFLNVRLKVTNQNFKL